MKKRWLFIALLYFCSAVRILSADQDLLQPSVKNNILVINSYHQGFLWTDTLVDAVIHKISQQCPQSTFYIEYMDAKRFTDKTHPAEMARYLHEKYRNLKPDIIIVSDDAALSFMKKFRDTLFPGVPVFYCGINELSHAQNLPADFGGILESLDIPDNLRLIHQILPNVHTIAVVTDGTATGLGTRREIQHAAETFPAYTFLYLNGEELSTNELLVKLSNLPQNSAVIAPAWYMDKSGRVLTNDESYPLIAKASPVPVIVTSAANLGLGVLGGKVNSGETQGEYAASLALKVLNRTITPADFTLQIKSHNRYIFDAQQLSRFGIDIALLPPDRLIVNKPFSFYQAYKELVWAVVLSFSIFTVLIVLLVIIVARLRQAKRKLSTSEEDLRITLHSIGDAVIRTDVSGLISGMNPVAEKLIECSEDLCLGHPLLEVCRFVTVDGRRPRECPAYETLRNGNTINIKRDVVMLTQNGRELSVSTSCAPIRNTTGSIRGVVMVCRDITEELQIEEKLRHSQKMDAIGKLAGGVAHDFNNMLGGILGAAEMALHFLPSDSGAQHYIDIIANTAERAAALTDKLLVFSRKGNPFLAPIHAGECIRDGVAILKCTINKDIDIYQEFRAAKDVIVGDSSQIQNAIINLGVNAAHAMPNGGTLSVIMESLHLEQQEFSSSGFSVQAGDYLEVRVQDTGCGIDPEILPHIFEPFFTTKDIGKGTGLGLSTVYGIMKDHHGMIRVESIIGKGTCFYLYFPLVNEECVTPVSLKNSTTSASGTIFVIDDEEAIRITLQSMLENQGYRVLTATDGQSALNLYSDHWQEIGLVIMDMVMPKMNGIDCFLRMQELNPQLKCLICSGYAQDSRAMELLQKGLAGFIKKPYRKDELLKAVATVICVA